MSTNVGVGQKLTEAWRVKSLFIEYNGCLLEDGDFVEFEQILGGNKVTAVLTFLDNQGFTTGAAKSGTDPRVGGIVKVEWTDALGCEVSTEYNIDKIDSQKDKKEQTLVTLTMSDMITRNMKGTHKAKGYPDMKYTDGIKDFLKKELKLDPKEIVIVPPKKEKKANKVQGDNL